MKRSSEYNTKGKLYIISTPIGNLKDITYRALEVIKDVDFLFCEDTRVSMKLLSYYDIKRSVDSFHDYSDSSKEEYIMNILKEGKSVGIISDCGTPLINDPGYELARKAHKENVDVVPIPGASASLSSLIKSGLPPKPFMFYGFLDHKESKKREELESLKNINSTIIFYESPNRIKETLKIMKDVFGSCDVCLTRELTKMYEESIDFNLDEIDMIPDDLKGEMVLVVSPIKEEIKEEIDFNKEIDALIKEGLSLKEASKVLALKANLKASDLYNNYLRCKK